MKLALAAALLAGCAHTADPGLRPIAPVPTGATTDVMTTRDGTQLAVLHWAAVDKPRGVLVITHGLKDYGERYAAFATKLAARGYDVYAFDLRGHGHSSGPRVYPRRWRVYVEDLQLVIARAKKEHAELPVFVFGHSMGGAIATLGAIDSRDQVAGLILSAPALAINAAPLLLAATRMAGALTPGAKALDLPNADFSSDPAAGKAMGADPLIEQEPGPARTAAGLVDGMSEIWQRTDALTMPILALHGTRDSLTAPSGSRELVRAAASTDKTLRIYEGLFHDLLHEPNGGQVADDIAAWLDAHTGGDAVIAPPIFPGRLRGEPGEWLQAISFSGGVHGLDSGDIGFAGLAAIHLGKLRPFGWQGSLTGQLAGNYRAVSLRPLGVVGRIGAAALGFSGGVSAITGTHVALSLGALAELPFGPAHFSLLAERQRAITDLGDHGPLDSDLLLAALSVRYGGDRHYWPHAAAGVGPVVTGGVMKAGSAAADWFVTLGLQLYGAD